MPCKRPTRAGTRCPGNSSGPDEKALQGDSGSRSLLRLSLGAPRCSEPESPRIVQNDGLISVVPHFLEPNGYCERILLLWSGSIAGLTVTTGLSVTGRRRQRLTATAPCRAAIPAYPSRRGRGARHTPTSG